MASMEIVGFVYVAPMAVIRKEGVPVIVSDPGQTDESVALIINIPGFTAITPGLTCGVALIGFGSPFNGIN